MPFFQVLSISHQTFEQDQMLRHTFVVQTFTTLIVGIGTLPQCPVIDVAATPKGLCQDALLFLAWIEAVLVGFLLLHLYSRVYYAVKCQTVSPPYPPETRTRLSSRPLKGGRVFPARLYKDLDNLLFLRYGVPYSTVLILVR